MDGQERELPANDHRKEDCEQMLLTSDGGDGGDVLTGLEEI